MPSPLIFDAARGIPRPLAAGETAEFPGPASFNGVEAPASAPKVGGAWHELIDQLINALASCGFIEDHRPDDWAVGLAQLVELSEIGPYQPGRLIVGSMEGWTFLDPPLGLPDGATLRWRNGAPTWEPPEGEHPKGEHPEGEPPEGEPPDTETLPGKP